MLLLISWRIILLLCWREMNMYSTRRMCRREKKVEVLVLLRPKILTMVLIAFVALIQPAKWLSATNVRNGSSNYYNWTNDRYHMKCLKINKKKFDQNEGWDCPICDWKKEIPRSSTRPTLSQLKEWVDLAAPLPFLPEELRTVNQIIAGADAWVASIQPLLQAGQIRSISKCRFYLRKIEGAEVFLPNEYNFFRQAAHQLAPLTSTPPPVIEESKSLKKTKPRKPKLESIGHQAPHPHQQQAPRFSIRPSYDPHHQEQQRILPAQGPPRQLPLEHPQQAPPQAYQSQPRFLSYDPASVPILNSQPPKGMFAPPPQQGFPSQNPTKENRRLSDHLGERPAPTCGCCHRDFISGAHNEPKNCSQCHRLYHLQCIGKYGGRIYPSMVW